MATQVQLPLIEIEVTMLFLNTLQKSYYDRLMPTVTGSFANMIKMRNLVDHAIKNDRIDMGENSCHNGFSLDLEDHKNQMESPPIFSVRM